MGVTARVLNGERRQGKAPWDDFWYGPVGINASGVEVTRSNILGLTATWKAVRLLSQSMATMGFKLYRRRDDGGRDPAIDDPRFWIAYARPNPWQTSFRFREMVQGHQELRGNAYAQIVENRRGELLYTIPLHPDRMVIESRAGELVYRYTRPDDTVRYFDPSEIIHWRHLTDDGLYGLDPLWVLREAFGIAIATQRFRGKYFENDATPGGVLSTDQVVDDETHDRMKRSWTEAHKGVESSHKPAILEAGLTWQSIGITAENAQMIEAHGLGTEELARAFDVPPHMVGASSGDSLTYTTVESAGIEFRQYAVLPRATRAEQEMDMALLTPEEQQNGLFFKFNLNTLLRADSEARANYMYKRWQMGSLNADDIRALDDENPLPDGQGQQYFVPANVISLERIKRGLEGRSEQRGAGTDDPEHRELPAAAELRQENEVVVRARLRETYWTLIQDTAQGVVNQEVREARDALERAFADEPSRSVRRWMAEFREREQRDAAQEDVFLAWIDEFYDDFDERWIAALSPVFLAYAETMVNTVLDQMGRDPISADEIEDFVEAYTRTMATAQVSSSVNQLREIIDEEDDDAVRAALTARLDDWEVKKAGKVGERESAQLGNASALEAFLDAGVRFIKWRKTGQETCPWCEQLDGEVVAVGDYFVREDQILHDGEGEDRRTFRARQNYSHPPLHRGCDCQAVAEDADDDEDSNEES